MTRILARVIALEPAWVAVLALPLLLPGHFLPLANTPLLVLLLFGFWPLRALAASPAARREALRTRGGHPLALPIAALLAVLPVSYAAAADRRIAWILVGYLCVGICLAEAWIHSPPLRRHPGVAAGLIAAAVAGLSLVGPGLLQPGVIKDPGAAAFFAPIAQRTAGWGETVNANVLAGGLVPGIPLVLALALGPWGRGWARGVGIVRSLLLLGLAWWLAQVLTLTDSRGGLLAAGVSAVLVVVLRWPHLWRAAAAGAAAALAWLIWQGPWQTLTALMAGGLARDYNGRMEIWVRSWLALLHHPLTGIGLGSFDPVVVLGMDPVRVPLAPGQGLHAHNLLLQVGVDLGFIGLAAYAAVVVRAGWGLWRSWQSGDPARRTLAGAGLGALAALMIHGLVDAPLWNTKLAWIPWLIFALAVLVEGLPARAPQIDPSTAADALHPLAAPMRQTP